MAELPRNYLKPSKAIRDLKEGDRAAFPLDAMRVDLEHHGWLDPMAEPIESPSAMSPYLSVERVEGGFRIYLDDAQPGHWSTGAKPGPKEGEGLEWYPVVEFVGGVPEPNSGR